MIGSLAVLYLALTLNALNCALTHTFATQAAACATDMPGMAHAGHGDNTPHADTQLPQTLCQCLDNVSAHGPTVVAMATAMPSTAQPRETPSSPALASAPAGTSGPRAPPAPIA